MRVEPYQPEHLRLLKLQPIQRWCQSMLDDELLNELKSCEGYTGFIGDVPVICAGTIELWHGRHLAWSFLGEQAGKHMFQITRVVSRYLEMKQFRRVEAYVDSDFPQGHRWIKRLGFTYEGTMEAFLPDGRNQALYARVYRAIAEVANG